MTTYHDIAPVWYFEFGPVHDGQIIAWAPATPKPNLDLKPNVPLEISIQESGANRMLTASEVLIDLHKFVRWEAFPTLQPFL